jgi:hypothetical protein
VRLTKALIPVLGVLAIAAVAKADTFNFSSVTLTENKGSTKIYGTVSGFVNIDPATGVVQSTGNNFIATFGATDSNGDNPTASYTFTNLTNPDSVNPSHGYIDAVFTATDGVTKFDLEFTDVSGVITLCSTTNGLCNQGQTGEQTHLDTSPNEDLIVGSLVPAATPEPGSLLLLGTGLLGFAGKIARKRS